MLLDFNADASEVFAAAQRRFRGTAAVGRRDHRQAPAAAGLAGRRLQHYSARVLMEQHFRPTVADPGYDVVTENRYFRRPDGVEWEELSFSVNGSQLGRESAAVSAAAAGEGALAAAAAAVRRRLSLSSGRRGQVDGFDCYVVAFDPVEQKRSLYRGTVWIDRRTLRAHQRRRRCRRTCQRLSCRTRRPALSPGVVDRRPADVPV